MKNEDGSPRVNLQYVLAQLARALGNTSGADEERPNRWRRVLAGLLDGTLRVGSRTPVGDTPAWVTLEVVHGGFATGGLAAGGPLLPHEKVLSASIGSAGMNRSALNVHFLGDLGRAELNAMLESGCYRVSVPEEGALLAAAWLMKRGEAAKAANLIDTVMPFFDRLRFYPLPHPRPARTGDTISLRSAGACARDLRSVRPQRSVAKMNEAINVWAPLYDRVVALFLETVDGDPPRLQTTSTGEMARGVNGQPIVEGGWPCRFYPEGFGTRASALLAELANARKDHPLCRKPDKPKENLARLRVSLAACANAPEMLSGRDVGMIRRILASYCTRHGAPGSVRLNEKRTTQRRNVSLPVHDSIARLLAEVLEQRPEDEGIPDVVALVAAQSEGASVPPRLVSKALRCLAAPVEVLVERGLVGSSEVLADVLPQLTARIRSEAVQDPELRTLFEGVYVAFRRRRSLLLLDLESQVKLSELPWISAVEPWVGSTETARASARATLVRTATLAIGAFPQTILPNKLVREFRALAAGAGEPQPFVDELAADIFMGEFSANYLRAAKVAATTLQGSLYERYYGVPFDRVLQLDDPEAPRGRTSVSPGFARLCRELATPLHAEPRSSGVARNGTVIEQAQILTTHNLSVLFHGFGLASAMDSQLPGLARACFVSICRRQQARITGWQPQLQMMKNTAYSWRQMIFFLSLMDAQRVAAFLEFCESHLGRQRHGFRDRFEPVVAGLRAAVSGETFDQEGRHTASGGRRFLGWSLGRHWLLPAEVAA